MSRQSDIQVRVRVGQVWRDNDKRMRGKRVVKVLAIEGEHALCSVFLGGVDTNRATKIALRRFRPTSTGYVPEESLCAAIVRAVAR